MTVSYSLDVAKAKFCGFTKLLVRWKGSIYKILWREFLVFCFAYAVISATYRNCLNAQQKIVFEKVVNFVSTFTDMIPLSFVLGFYVSLVVGRWWSQYETIPWPDRLCIMIASYVHGSDERSRKIRRTLGRYVILAQVLTFQAVSTAVKRRFPTTQHLVAAGIMTKEEQSVYEKISFPYGKWWLPCHWFSALAARARREGRIKDSILLNGLFKEILDYRNSCAIMFGYDWISVPLVYTQVVTIATYIYCIALLIGRQYLDPAKGYPNNEIDLYIPFFTLLQFFFYVGWLKVAEQILNPYGEDDDDFELNWCLDRAVHIAYLVVDNIQLKHPKISKDFFWNETEPMLPQTRRSAKWSQPQLGSAFNFEVGEAEYLPMEELLEQDADENVYKSDSVKRGSEYRPSLIRRLLSSGFRQSHQRKTLRKQNSSNYTTSSQGVSNAAFESNEKNTIPNRKQPVSPTSSLNNAVLTSSSDNRPSSVAFRPNSLSQHKNRIYDSPETQKKPYPLQALNSAPEKHSDIEVTPVLRSASSPPRSTMEKPQSSALEVEDDSLEEDLPDTEIERTMSCIPEETPRGSSATVEAGNVKAEENSLKRFQHVQNLVQEANEVLKELNRSASVTEGRQEPEYSGCDVVKSCSTNDEGHSSDESEDESKEVKSENRTSVGSKTDDAIAIDIEENKEQITTSHV